MCHSPPVPSLHRHPSQVEVIGGKDKYMAVCRTCYNLPEKPHLLPTTPTPPATSDSVHTPPSKFGELPHGRQLLFDVEQGLYD